MARLLRHHRSISTTTDNSKHVDEVGDDEGMESAARDALGGALEAEALSVEGVGGKLFVGNRRGLQFAGFSERTRILEEQAAEIPALRDEIVALKAEVGSLGERVSSLTTMLDAYKLLRNRLSELLSAINSEPQPRPTGRPSLGATHGRTAAMPSWTPCSIKARAPTAGATALLLSDCMG